MSVGVVVAWISPGEVSSWFCYSLADMLRYDAQGPRHISGPDGGITALRSGPRVAEARNQVVDAFARLHPNAEWLLMVDSDMTFEPDFLEKMLAVADPKEVPILGALAFAQGDNDSPPYPTIYREIPAENGYVHVGPVREYPPDRLVKCGATGAAGLLIHRGVLAAMQQPWPKGFGTREDGTENPYPWFSEGLASPDGRQLGEDIAFCRRAVHMGIPIHVHTGIKMGHMKTFELDEAYYLDARARAAGKNGTTRAEARRAARELAKK